ncbi:type IX secretion system sortase PorU [Gynurincola endophyticus]|uniref:type IX secretion system sortase PorU n=1 Tax=Gynurincola endophyticus TaxID=2479004 RepID=UPI000F8C77B0|nr:type IX secretion system sortase PorU [Gynurincola endophyticus]
MTVKKLLFLFLFLIGILNNADSQTIVQPVLDSQTVFRVGVSKNGVFQLTGRQLEAMGWNLPVPSQQIQAFGTGSDFPKFTTTSFTIPPLQEIALQVLDGGDGMIDFNDQIRWYANAYEGYQISASGPLFFKNNYDTLQYYYFQKTNRSLNINSLNHSPAPATELPFVYTAHKHEKDSFNLLSSGRDWWGDFYPSLNQQPSEKLFLLQGSLQPDAPIYLRCRTASRSFGAENIFTFRYQQQTHQFAAAAVSGSPYELFAQINEEVFSFTGAESTNQLQLSILSTGINAQAWIDYIEWETPVKNSSLQSNQLFYINKQNQQQTIKLNFPQWKNQWKLWNVTSLQEPVEYIVADASAYVATTRTELFYVFDASLVSTPDIVEKVKYKNLFEPLNSNYIIITTKELREETERIAAFHNERNTVTAIVDIDDIYCQFGNHVSAVRNFIGYQYQLSPERLKYILLVGSGSFDPVDKMKYGKNSIPAFQTKNSVDPLATYTADDYFVSLRPGADFDQGNNLGLQLSIGRLPVKNAAALNAYINKFLEYYSENSRGAWKQKMVFVADDGDQFLHFDDAEAIVNKLPQNIPYWLHKIYFDAYNSVQQNGIKTYPAAVNENINLLNKGVLLWNYSGHGGYSKLADENLLDAAIIQQLKNRYRLPLMITATCNFAPYDQVQYSSIGEQLLLQPQTGAIAVLSTTRIVYANSNRRMNEAFIEALFDQSVPLTERTVGRSLMRAKNKLYAEGDINNNAKFTLLGDPALQLLMSETGNFTDSIVFNNQSVDTLKATNEYTLKAGSSLNNGTANLLILNKPVLQKTIGSNGRTFQQQSGIIYQGSAVLKDGKFSASFVIPADAQYEYSRSKILYYLYNANEQLAGIDQTKWIGGKGNGAADNAGPDIKLYLNDEKFVSGGITNNQPMLIAKIKDSTGINLLGTGLGHDIQLTINNDPQYVYTLNKFFEPEREGNKAGVVRFQLPQLPAGMHRLKIRAWDVYNQWSEKELDFQVVENGEFVIRNVLNYPNPFTTNTNFWFEHNRPGEELQVTVQIYTVTGKLVKTIRETIITEGTRSNEMPWNAKDQFGNTLGRGVYIYKITVKTREKQEAMKFEKLFIL